MALQGFRGTQDMALSSWGFMSGKEATEKKFNKKPGSDKCYVENKAGKGDWGPLRWLGCTTKKG